MRILLPCLITYLLFLVIERIRLNRSMGRIPCRIAITGTRGKSGVARLLASILKEDGRRVMAKTTGSEAVILLPDGGQIELDRSLRPSILEQKQLVHRAARLRVDCLVAEIMSIHPENHFVESHRLLKPELVAITNVRPDHTEAMGDTEEEIASVLSLAIRTGSTVFVPEREMRESFRAEARNRGATLMPVPPGTSESIGLNCSGAQELEFPDNLDLVCAVADHLGVSGRNIIRGIQNARQDIGRLKIWRYGTTEGEPEHYLVNAFAANDPVSTLQVLDRICARIPAAAGNIVGVINLRADRLPRTSQWISVLRRGGKERFRRLFVIGEHSGVVRRRLPDVQVLKGRDPQAMTRMLCSATPAPGLVFGFGNVKGAGRLLIEYWDRVGGPYGV